MYSKERAKTDFVYSGPVKGEISTTAVLNGILKDKNGTPLAGKEVMFIIGDQSVTTITDSNGIAMVSITLPKNDGKYYRVFASFKGDPDYLPSSEVIPYIVMK